MQIPASRHWQLLWLQLFLVLSHPVSFHKLVPPGVDVFKQTELESQRLPLTADQQPL